MPRSPSPRRRRRHVDAGRRELKGPESSWSPTAASAHAPALGYSARQASPRKKMATSRSQPTARQREYLSFIKAFTDRWGVPPSFEEIGRHFETTAPSVNGM